MKITLVPKDRCFVENIQSLYRWRGKVSPHCMVVSLMNGSAAKVDYVRILPGHLAYSIAGEKEDLVRLEDVYQVSLDWFS